MGTGTRWLVALAAVTLLGGPALFAVAQDKKAVSPEPAKEQANFPKVKEFRLELGMSKQAQACIECHKVETPGIFADWAASRHAAASAVEKVTALPLSPRTNGTARGAAGRPRPSVVAIANGATRCAASVWP